MYNHPLHALRATRTTRRQPSPPSTYRVLYPREFWNQRLCNYFRELLAPTSCLEGHLEPKASYLRQDPVSLWYMRWGACSCLRILTVLPMWTRQTSWIEEFPFIAPDNEAVAVAGKEQTALAILAAGLPRRQNAEPISGIGCLVESRSAFIAHRRPSAVTGLL